MMTTQETTLNEVFLRFLKTGEDASTALTTDSQLDLHRESGECARQLVDRLALFGAGMHANMRLMYSRLDQLRKVDGLDQSSTAPLLAAMDLGCKFVEVYSSEAEFCLRFERMVRASLATKAGIDPDDDVAVNAWLTQESGRLTSPPIGNN